MVKKVLDKFGVKFEVVDVTDSYEDRLKLQRDYSAQTVPVLVREDGQYTVGYNLPQLLNMVR
jgi:glutaredoxin